MSRHFSDWRRKVGSALSLVLVTSAVAAALPVPAAVAATNTLVLDVRDAETNAQITSFRYLLNIDNTGTTSQRPDPVTGAPPTACTPADPGYPDSCAWVSIAGAAPYAPIYTQGDETDFAGGGGIDVPDGRYLVSVLADGYKLDGAHFSAPMAGQVTVLLQPTPLPDATIRAKVFQDVSPTNGAPDVPAEAGLAGFRAILVDYLGEVTTDVYGNPLCTVYEGEDPVTHAIPPGSLDPDGVPIVQTLGGNCFSDANGDLVVPHMGPNRYALSAVPPDGSGWIQTTTLEGNHDWDTWVMEGATGFDTEFVVAGEQFPPVVFGFVKPRNTMTAGTGSITGIVEAFKAYVPAKGGAVSGEPLIGSRPDHPIETPWLSLSDLGNGDTAVWIGHGNADGSFTIPNVPAGTYTLTWWDEPQDYILNLQNVTVAPGEKLDLGLLPMNGWWANFEGFVFNDTNRNGVKDPGEKGLANFPITMRKRENSLMDRGWVAGSTDAQGHYFMENAYPMTQWLVMEAYNDLYYTTGVTYQADNQDNPTTILGAGVDVSVLPIIGLGGRLDWGVHAYAPTGGEPGIDPDNGGIVGTVSYDTTRNELDPRYAAVEDWQPGIPDLTVDLYLPVDCGTNAGVACDDTEQYELAPDGSIAKGAKINSYITETWERPGVNGDGDCVPRDVNGDPLAYPADQKVTNSSTDCLEGPLMGIQFQAGFSTVNGNYGFGDGCFGDGGATGPEECADGSDPVPLTPGDYLVDVVVPDDALGRPLYKVTREEDINIGNGDQFIPQIPPPACAGPLHTVDVAGLGTDGYGAIDYGNGVTVPASTPTDNPTFVDIGTPFEGQARPLCNTKLVTVSNGRSVAPTFNYFTDVPLPGRFWGLIVDDLNFSSNPSSLLYGEKAGVPFAPVGIYDYTNRLITTVESDYNGLFDVLLPSTNRINCPTPSGVCANLYRFVGNDPGIPGRLNANFKPQFRTIAAEFEAFPGLLVPADLAPTQVGMTIQLPTGQFNQVQCPVNDPAAAATRPELFAVSKPYADFRTGTAPVSFALTGQGFGAGAGTVALDGAVLATPFWSDTSIQATVPSNLAPGPHQLTIRNAASGLSSVNGLTFHVLGFGPFPSTPVLDNFNRTGFGPDWNVPGGNTFTLSSPTGSPDTSTYNVRVTGTGTMRWAGSTGGGPVYGANQEAYFTFYKVSPTATEQGLFLKVSGNGNNPDPTANGSAYIEVSYNAPTASNPTRPSVQVRTKRNGTNTVVLQANFPTTFGTNDTLGARALADGTVIAYKNGIEIGRVNVVTNPAVTAANRWLAANAANGGRIGIRFVGVQNNTTNDARFDNFGGGTAVGYVPNVYEVGPGKAYATVQGGIDAAAASSGDDLVVVYPGTASVRTNPRGAYYENLVIASPVKLQGVGSGGIIKATGATVPGSILDGSAFGGDTALADAWRTRIAGLTWVGFQPVEMPEGEVILLLAQSNNQYGSTFKAAIDGFDIRGGDQMGQVGTVTQGGAIYAHAYVRNLQVTNNVVEGNSGSYGTIRVGTPNLPAPDTNQHNEGVRIANNRIIHNAGTNLAGGIAVFAGADNYEVAANDICGNFSAEYGGGLSVYGLSPNGKIHDNRIYFNESYDEGGGVMIAGQLPANPSTLSPGSGAVDIYNNLIQANLANDDGGGIRFLMAGNFPMNVFNNMIVNNVSTHEGGGIALDDAPKVRIFNNTIMKNITTATAVTSTGIPAPAGLSTGRNSAQLQPTLPAGSPVFSNPLLFNNIFWDNRAGSRGLGTVTGIGAAGDPTPINHWDLGAADGSGTMSPTYSVIQAGDGIGGTGNLSADPGVVSPFDIPLSFAAWRTNPNFVDAVMIVGDLPPNLLGNYRLALGSPAIDAGAASKAAPSYQQPPASIAAPAFDIDNQSRPVGGGFDIGAHEYR